MAQGLLNIAPALQVVGEHPQGVILPAVHRRKNPRGVAWPICHQPRVKVGLLLRLRLVRCCCVLCLFLLHGVCPSCVACFNGDHATAESCHRKRERLRCVLFEFKTAVQAACCPAGCSYRELSWADGGVRSFPPARLVRDAGFHVCQIRQIEIILQFLVCGVNPT